MVRILDTFTFGRGHEVEVNGLASDDGAERAVFHDDHAVAELGDEKGGLSCAFMIRSGVFNVGHGVGSDGRDSLAVNEAGRGVTGGRGGDLALRRLIWLIGLSWVHNE